MAVFLSLFFFKKIIINEFENKRVPVSETRGYFLHASTRYFKISGTSLAFVSKGPALSSSAAETCSK